MKFLRILIPTVLIAVWFAAGAIGGPYFGRIGEVSSNDQASYLPASADATEVSALLPDFAGSDDIPAIVVAARDGGLTDDDLDALTALADDLPDVEGVGDGVSPAIESDDGDAVQVIVPIAGDVDETVLAIEAVLADLPDGLTAYVTGPAGFTADLVGAFAGIDGLLLLVAFGAVLVILIIVYRSPLLPLIVLGTAVFALSLAILVVWWLAKAEVVQINGQVQGILFILVIGAATDYALLYVARYREALRDHERRWDATWAALARLVRADRRERRHRDRRAPLPAAQRPQLEQVARTGRRDRHRVRAARGAHLPSRAHDVRRPGGVLAAQGRVRQRAPAGARRGCPWPLGPRGPPHLEARPPGVDRLHARAAGRRSRTDPVPRRRGRPERARAHRQPGPRRPGGARRALPGRLRQPGARRG